MSFQAPIATGRSVTGIPTGKLAMWMLLASEFVIFGGLVVCYLLYRLHNDYYGVLASHTSLLAGSVNTFVLLTSSLFIVLAHHAAEVKDTKTAVKYMNLTILCALLFVGVKTVEYSMKIMHGYTAPMNPFFAFYFTATAIHAGHVVAGATAIYLVSLDVKKGKNLQRVELTGIYWHFVDLVWIFLFPLLYIAK